MNIIKKDCPNEICDSTELDILGVIIINNKPANQYRCGKCNNTFFVPRTKEEQELVQEYIDASKIILIGDK